MTDWSKCPAVESVPGRLSGAWVFTGTRLPVSSLFENLESGATVEEFLEWFDGAEEWKVRAVLQHVADSMKAAMPAGTLENPVYQGTPRPLRSFLPEHAVDTAAGRGWSELSNGELLDIAESEGYELLITTDQNIRHQQNLAGRRLAVIVLLSGAWPYARSRIEEIRAAAAEVQGGELREVPISIRGEG